jgi:hypothetical protein
VSSFEDLERARRRLGLSVETLWLAYAGLGGSASLQRVGDFLQNGSGLMQNGSGLTARQYDYLVQALNDRFVETGEDHPLPYSETMEEEQFDVE